MKQRAEKMRSSSALAGFIAVSAGLADSLLFGSSRYWRIWSIIFLFFLLAETARRKLQGRRHGRRLTIFVCAALFLACRCTYAAITPKYTYRAAAALVAE